jgi:DnaJ-class molecular chaperone
MTPDEAWQKMEQAEHLRDAVRDAFPCEECDGIGEHYPGHHWDPCTHCDGTGIDIPDEEDE